METDVRHPVKGYDTDTEDRLLPSENYRYGNNGRSGTSDKDGVGAVEGLRGNTQVMWGAPGDRIIVSCPDVKNNAVIRFVQNGTAPVALTYSGASVSTTSPLVVVIAVPSVTLTKGMFLSIAQAGPNTFVGQVVSNIGTSYTLKLISGTPTLAAISSITRTFYNYIRRYYDSTGVDEYLINPVLMSSVLAWSSATRIYNPRVIESGFTQFLVWTDPIPRCMDIDKMKE